ncbi:Ada metal-binding domain-containing protein [Hydrogenophaga sp.]|uniref:Ada metal-binding domain-containing protein n=1 Tax=Hydrogenophaga sp. TaxID=1904254 RepID=UPI0035AF4B4B
MPNTPSQDDEALYRALSTRDARFDGRFFTGVTSTGIYCRPICRVRTPRRDNCRFFEHPAQAEQAGFRPCLRCRPELAPRDRHWSTEDAGDILFAQALAWLDTPTELSQTSAMAQLSARLGVSDRHVRRLFEDRLGVSPLQYLLTRRLLTAKQLLADTDLPVGEVALASGFASIRRFNAAFVARYGMNPTQMRRGGTEPGGPAHSARDIRLAWRPPLQATALMRFFAERALTGTERVELDTLSLWRTLRLSARGQAHTGWLMARLEPEEHRLVLRVSEGLVPALPQVIARVRAVFDLDADPLAIDRALHADFPDGDGLRVPGTFDGFELAVRAILGQQVTVGAARTLAARLVQQIGEPVETPVPGLDRLFPTAEAIARARPSRLGELGIVRQRQQALQSLAQATLDGALALEDGTDPQALIARLQTLPGIGPWTAHYIAMRAARWPDAWPAGDVAMHHALGLTSPGSPAARKEADRLAQGWRPWRSYALIRAWAGTAQRPAPHRSHE